MKLLKHLLLVALPAAGALILTAGPAFAPCHIISWVGDPYSVSEGAGKVVIHVTNGANGGPGSVDYATVNGTAKAGPDYTSIHGTLTWPSSAGAEQAFPVPIKDDSVKEPNETFTVHLSHPTGCAATLPDHDAQVTIIDNDAGPASTPSHSSTPKPHPTPSPSPKPSRKATAAPASTPSPTPARSPARTTPSTSPEAAPRPAGGGSSGRAVVGIVVAALVAGGGAAILIRKRLLP